MIRLLLLFLLFAFLGASSLYAQLPPQCPSNNHPAEDFCQNICIYCNFNGYTGSSAGYTGQTPPGFCGTIENEQWLGFIAGATVGTFTVTPSNCQNGNGLQIALYTSCTSNPVACNGGSSGNGNNPVSITANLTPGVNYFLLIDGYAGDQCDFVVTVTPPLAAQAPPIAPPGAIQGPATMCPGGSFTFRIPTVNGAGGYEWNAPGGWLINGQTPPVIVEAPGGNVVTVTAGSTGGQICVTPISSCNTGVQVCRTVNVVPIPPTILSPVVVCHEDAPYLLPWGEEVSVSGTYQHTYTSYQGCDSVVRQQVTVKAPLMRNLGIQSICAGSCVTVCGEEFCDAGNYAYVCQSYQGCDSVINFGIIVVEPVAQITGGGVITCSTPTVTLGSAPSPGTKVWRDGNGVVLGTGNTVVVSQPGTVILTVTAVAGGNQCIRTDTIQITSNTTPPVVTASGGFLGCGNSQAQLQATSSVPNSTFSWSPISGLNNPNISNPLASLAGVYTVVVTSPQNGCTASASATVTGNTDPPQVTASGGELTCVVLSVPLQATSNVNGSTFAWSGPAGFSSSDQSPTVSAGGTYTVTVTSPVNNCTASATAVVTVNTSPPQASAVGGVLSCLSPVVTLQGNSPTSGVSWQWVGPGGFSSSEQNPVVDTAGVYTLVVTSLVNGCTSSSSATVSGNTQPPDASAVGGEISCAVPSLALSGFSSTPGAAFSWVGPGNFSSNAQNPVVSEVGTYVLTVTGMNACTSSATAEVTGDFAHPDASAVGGVITCTSSTTMLLGSSSTPGVTYRWIGPNQGIYEGPSPTVSNLGVYTLVVTAPNGCTATATAEVVPDSEIPQVSAVGGTLTCVVLSVRLNGTSNTSGAVLEWSGPGGFTSTEEDPEVSVPGVYVLRATNPLNGCTAIATAPVVLDDAAPGVQVQGGVLTCSTPEVRLQASSPTSGVSWQWTGPSGFSSSEQNPEVWEAGTYALVATGPNGCTSTAEVMVLSDQVPAEITASGGVLTCSVQSVGLTATSNVGVQWRWSGPGGFSSTEPLVTVSVGGLYTVIGTAGNGCTTTVEVEVGVDTVSPDIFAQGGVLSCSHPTLVLQGGSSTVGSVFRWLGPGGLDTSAPTPEVSLGGAYTLVVTGPNGCTSERTVDVLTDVEAPVVFAAVSEELTCARLSVRLEATATNATSSVEQYSWTGPGGYTSTEEDPLVSEPGAYTVVVISANGCSGSATVEVSQDVSVPDVSVQGDTLTCVILVGEVSGISQTAGVTYQWIGPGGFTSTQPSASVTEAGVYTLVVTGPNGCTSSSEALVVLDAEFPDLTAVRTNDLDCDKVGAQLVAQSATAGVEYRWSDAGGVFSTDPIVLITVGGTYTVTVLAPNGCESTAEVVVVQDTLSPGAFAQGDTINCLSGVAQLRGESPTLGVSYRWVGPGGFESQQASPQTTVAGLYELTVTGPNGCTSSATATVWANSDAPQVEVLGGGVLTCVVPQLTLRGRILTAGALGVWTGPGGFSSTDSVVVVNQSGTYTYTVTAPNGCVSSPQLVVTQDITPPQGVVVLGGILSCAQPQISLQASSTTPNVTYQWTGPGGFSSAQQNPVVSEVGTYTVVLTNVQNGCQATALTNVSGDFSEPVVTATGGTLTCSVPRVVLLTAVSPSNVTYQWVGPGITSANQGQSSPEVMVAGTYTVTVRGSNGCTSSATVVVQSDQELPQGVSVVGTTLTCSQPIRTITATSTTAGATYLWTGPNNFTSVLQTPEVSVGGQYTVVVTNPANGCTATATVLVQTDQQPPSVTAQGGILTCSTPSLVLLGLSNPVEVNWLWTGPGGFSSTVQNPEVSVAGTYTVTATSRANGCTSSSSATVLSDQQPPQLTIPAPGVLTCNTTQVGLTVQVVPSGSYTYAWTTQGGRIVSGSNSATAVVASAGQYTVLVRSQQNGCTSSATTEVRVDSSTISGAQLEAKSVSCYGRRDGSVRVLSVQGGTPPYLYGLGSQGLSPQQEFSALSPGTYTLYIQDANGCEWSTLFEVGEPAELLVDLGGDTTIYLGDVIRIHLDDVVNYPGRVVRQRLEPSEWLDSLGRDLRPLKSFRYMLEVVDSNGCRASDTRLVIVDKTRFVYVPNVFAPESGGENSTFYLSARYPDHVVNIKSFLIFDRWGNAVFERFNFAPNDPTLGWDGLVRGSKGQPGVYVYYAEVEFIDGETILYKGDVTLMR